MEQGDLLFCKKEYTGALEAYRQAEALGYSDPYGKLGYVYRKLTTAKREFEEENDRWRGWQKEQERLAMENDPRTIVRRTGYNAPKMTGKKAILFH